jgi:hypothetical protein
MFNASMRRRYNVNQSLWFWPLVLAFGFGLWFWPLVLAFGFGLWFWPLVLAFGFGLRLCAFVS